MLLLKRCCGRVAEEQDGFVIVRDRFGSTNREKDRWKLFRCYCRAYRCHGKGIYIYACIKAVYDLLVARCLLYMLASESMKFVPGLFVPQSWFLASQRAMHCDFIVPQLRTSKDLSTSDEIIAKS